MFILPHIFNLLSTNLQSSICHCSSPFLKLPFHLLSRRSSTAYPFRRHMKFCITATWASEGLHDILQLVHVKQDEIVTSTVGRGSSRRCIEMWRHQHNICRLADVDCRSVNVTNVASTSHDHSGGTYKTNTYLLDKFTGITCHLCSFKA